MIIRMALRCALVALGIPILASAAAAEGQGTADQRNACMADAFRFCMSSIPNSARVEACLRANRRSISSACYREIYDDAPAPMQKVIKQAPQERPLD